jgi:hypothetical protein
VTTDPLDTAQELFEKGSILDAADLLRQVRDSASARARVDVVGRVDDLVEQMRAHLSGSELYDFDRSLEGKRVKRQIEPHDSGLRSAGYFFGSVAAVILVISWIVAGSESCTSDPPASAILLAVGAVVAGCAGLAFGLGRTGRSSIAIGVVFGVLFAGISFLLGGLVWGSISFSHCPIGPFVEF